MDPSLSNHDKVQFGSFVTGSCSSANTQRPGVRVLFISVGGALVIVGFALAECALQ